MTATAAGGAGMDWVGICFAMHGRQYTATTAFVSKTDEIMSKYRPIAPKPALHRASNLCKSTDSSNSVLDFRSTFATTPNGINNKAETDNGGHNRSSHRKRASDCSKSSSPRVLKRSRGAIVNPLDERSSPNIVGTKMTVDGPKIAYPFDGSFSADKSTTEKDSGFMKRAAATERSMVQKRYGGFEGLDVKAVMNSNVEVGIENPPANMEAASVPRMPETQSDCRSVKYFVFPIVSHIQPQLQEVEKNPVIVPLIPLTLPLIPQTPLLQNDSVLGSRYSNSISTHSKTNTHNASYDKEEIQLRVFGRDFSVKEVGASKISSDESPKTRNFVPTVGLSFL